MATKKKPVKDLSPKGGNVKGGGYNNNDNMTLVRAAKPMKDLSPKKSPKGGAGKKGPA